jgi:MtN3 and saliva related transmembrane protein
MDTFVLGVIAGTLCTLSFIPQVMKVYKTKTAKGLSLPAFSALAIGVTLWFVYGFLKNDPAIIFANGVTLVLVISIVVMVLKYKNN